MVRNLSVLLVDPSFDSRLDAMRAIEGAGLDAAGQAAYGTETTFMASQHHPSVILMAIEDPPVRALATLEALQQQQPDTPVLVYSSSLDSSVMRRAMRAGARDFLEKPLSVQDLREAVYTVLSQEEQRQFARFTGAAEDAARGTVITVAGAKGGIGKTTLATSLAVLLREVTGQEVALLDGDVQFGDVGPVLDLEVERSVADLARREAQIDRESVSRYLVRHETGVDVLMTASEPDDWRAMTPEQLAAIVRALAETHEYVIVDTPGVMNDLVAAALAEAAIVLLITSLDLCSIRNTAIALRILRAWDVPDDRLRLVVNDCTGATAVRPDDVPNVSGLETTQAIPFDRAVGRSLHAGALTVRSEPKSRYARSVRAIAEAIAGVRTRDGRASRFPLIHLPLVGRS